jgi:hypothetical protein
LSQSLAAQSGCVAQQVLLIARVLCGIRILTARLVYFVLQRSAVTQLLFQQNALVLLKAQDITICTFLSLYS